MKRVIVTGCCGFIGSHFVERLMKRDDIELVIGIDIMSYASHVISFDDDRFILLRGYDIVDTDFTYLFRQHRIDTIIHFAAESHVDNSIDNVMPFVHTNIVGTLRILEALRAFPEVSLLHVSTDEVFGGEDECHDELSAYAPSNPYAATKASSDHLVRAFAKTYGLRCTVTNCTNNFGTRQHVEKLIPKTISRARAGNRIPIYGDGRQQRDWIFVDDHCRAIEMICDADCFPDTFCISTGVLRSNISVVLLILDMLDADHDLIDFVEDRPAHDLLYRVDSSKIRRELSWNEEHDFTKALAVTVDAEHRRLGGRHGNTNV
jgi:dTDP-glucose 4,6-dehydratase